MYFSLSTIDLLYQNYVHNAIYNVIVKSKNDANYQSFFSKVNSTESKVYDLKPTKIFLDLPYCTTDEIRSYSLFSLCLFSKPLLLRTKTLEAICLLKIHGISL